MLDPPAATVPPHAIVFDLGGVLIDWNPRYLFRKVFQREAEVEHFLSAVCTEAWNHAQDQGRSWEQAVDALSTQWPEYAPHIRAYHERWEETLGDALAETVDLLSSIKQRSDIRLIALTNWSQEKFPFARARFEFLQWFEGIVVSGEEGLAKPDPAIFERMNDRFDLKPEQTLFIDDSARNIQSARALGYRTIHFQNPRALTQALVAHGVLEIQP